MAGKKFQMRKSKWYPRPHLLNRGWLHSAETADQDWTIMPIAMYDEGKGAPDGYNSNPEHASFVSAGEPNCYPESTINNIIIELQFALTKGALETDKIHSLKVAFMPTFFAFKEDYIAIDELSSIEVQDVLEMQTESTDRQGFPLYDTNKITERFSNSALLPSDMPGLTSTQVIEHVAFDEGVYYNAIQYQTIDKKVKACSGGLKWLILTKDRPVRTFRIRLRPKVKFMNEYAFMGCLVGCPQVGTRYQIPLAGDTTAIPHVDVQFKIRYNEWNEHFDHARL